MVKHGLILSGIDSRLVSGPRPIVEGKQLKINQKIHITSDIAIVYTVKVWDGYKNARSKVNVF